MSAAGPMLIEPRAQDALHPLLDPQRVLQEDVEVVLRLNVGDPGPVDLLEAIADAADDLVVQAADDVELVLVDELDVDDGPPLVVSDRDIVGGLARRARAEGIDIACRD